MVFLSSPFAYSTSMRNGLRHKAAEFPNINSHFRPTRLDLTAFVSRALNTPLGGWVVVLVRR